MTAGVSIRDLAAGDSADWNRLCADYLSFLQVKFDPVVPEQIGARALDPASPIHARVAADADGLLGFAIFAHHPSTFFVNGDGYLEDLFVDERARGQGIGRALIDDLKVIARDRGWRRLYWHTQETNSVARKFYDSIVPSDGHVRYRLYLDR